MRPQRFKEGDKVWTKKQRTMTLHDGDHRRPSCWVVMKAHEPKGNDEWTYNVALKSDMDRRVQYPITVLGVADHRLRVWEGE